MQNRIVIMCTGNEAIDRALISKAVDANSTSFIELVMETFSQNSKYHQYLEYLKTTNSAVSAVQILKLTSVAELSLGIENIDLLQDHTYLYRIPNLLLVMISIAVAKTEGSEKNHLWIGLSDPDLKAVTPDVPAYLEKIKDLAAIGIHMNHKIELHFELFDEDYGVLQNSMVTTDPDRSLILFSSGLDCIAAAYVLKALGKELNLLAFKYGHSNRYQEAYYLDRFVKETTNLGDFKYREVELTILKDIGHSACLHDDVEINQHNLDSEYIPFRNTVFIGIAMLHAIQSKIKYIVTGSHLDDSLSPDNRVEYFETFQKVLDLQYCTKEIKLFPVGLHLGGKKELLYTMTELGGDPRISWSCLNYIPEERAGYEAIQCGTCGNCSTRYSAFRRLGMTDPIPYKVLPKIRTSWSGWAEDAEVILQQIHIKRKDL